MSALDRPILILGAARSGTSMISRVLQLRPDVAFSMEPKHIWKLGGALAPDDVVPADEATPGVRKVREQQGVVAAWPRSGGKASPLHWTVCLTSQLTSR